MKLFNYLKRWAFGLDGFRHLDPPENDQIDFTLGVTYEVDVPSKFFTRDAEGDTPCLLVIQLTHEGVIADLIFEGEVIDTWAHTAQEFVEDLILA